MTEERRRSTDPLLEELIGEVKGFRDDMQIMRKEIAPLQELLLQVSSAKTAAIWVVGIFAAIGATITWAINLRDHISK